MLILTICNTSVRERGLLFRFFKTPLRDNRSFFFFLLYLTASLWDLASFSRPKKCSISCKIL